MNTQNPPRTPSPPSSAPDPAMWVPPTPRYAPIDEPDNFPGISKSYIAKSRRLEQAAASQAAQRSSKLLTRTPAQQIVDRNHRRHISGEMSPWGHSMGVMKGPSALYFPLTPEQTPARKKKRELDTIQRQTSNSSAAEPITNTTSTTQLRHPGQTSSSGRIIFPPNTNIVGSGRSYHRLRPVSALVRPAEQVSAEPSLPEAVPSAKDLKADNNQAPSPSTRHQLHEVSSTLSTPRPQKTDTSACRVPSPLRQDHLSPRKNQIHEQQHSQQQPHFQIFHDMQQASSKSHSHKIHQSPAKKAQDTFVSKLLLSAKKPKNQPTHKNLSFISTLAAPELSKKIEDNDIFTKNVKRGADKTEYDMEGIPKGLLDEVDAEDEEYYKNHPHHPVDYATVPGMWCVFRGKKVFRPFPEGDPKWNKITPCVLFPKKDSRSLEESCTPITKRSTSQSPVAVAVATSSSLHSPSATPMIPLSSFPQVESSNRSRKRSMSPALSLHEGDDLSLPASVISGSASSVPHPSSSPKKRRRLMVPSPSFSERITRSKSLLIAQKQLQGTLLPHPIPTSVASDSHSLTATVSMTDLEDELTDHEDGAPLIGTVTPRKGSPMGAVMTVSSSHGVLAAATVTLPQSTSSSPNTQHHQHSHNHYPHHQHPHTPRTSIKRNQRFFR